MKAEMSDLSSIIHMMENLDKYVDACTSSESLHLSKLNQLTTDFPATGFQINDISIVYREKRVK